MADETKAANHIDFTSKTYEGPSLMKGKELLAETREKFSGLGESLQHGWYYSGQTDTRVIREQDPRATGPEAASPMYRTGNSTYGSAAPLPPVSAASNRSRAAAVRN